MRLDPEHERWLLQAQANPLLHRRDEDIVRVQLLLSLKALLAAIDEAEQARFGASFLAVMYDAASALRYSIRELA